MRHQSANALIFASMLLMSTLSIGLVHTLNQPPASVLDDVTEPSQAWYAEGTSFTFSCQQPTGGNDFRSHTNLSFTLCYVEDIQTSSLNLSNVNVDIDLTFGNLNNSSFQWTVVNKTNASTPWDFNYSVEVEGYYLPSATQFASSIQYTAEVTLTGTNTLSSNQSVNETASHSRYVGFQLYSQSGVQNANYGGSIFGSTRFTKIQMNTQGIPPSSNAPVLQSSSLPNGTTLEIDANGTLWLDIANATSVISQTLYVNISLSGSVTDGVNTSTYAYSLNNSYNLTADFILDEPSFHTTISGNTIENGYTFSPGTNITITASTYNGFYADGWVVPYIPQGFSLTTNRTHAVLAGSSQGPLRTNVTINMWVYNASGSNLTGSSTSPTFQVYNQTPGTPSGGPSGAYVYPVGEPITPIVFTINGYYTDAIVANTSVNPNFGGRTPEICNSVGCGDLVYRQNMSGSRNGGINHIEIISANLSGLTFTAANLTLWGTPTANITAENLALVFNASVGNDTDVADFDYLFNLSASTDPPSLQGNVNTVNVTQNQAFTLSFVNQGTLSRNWSISPSLPSGAMMNTSTGIITGNLSSLGNTTYTITASNYGGTSSHNFTLSVQQNSTLDTDGDGTPDITDNDDDNDGTPDSDDAFPLDADEDTDTDGDGTGDNADNDDDNDGTPDADDDFPLDSSEDTDTDGDGTGDNADNDDDNDGTPDSDDDFPLDSSEDTDTDGDGTGNNADNDDDNDGTPDSDDDFPLRLERRHGHGWRRYGRQRRQRRRQRRHPRCRRRLPAGFE